jgi:hypothetical protein
VNGILNRVRTWFGSNGHASTSGDTPKRITATATKPKDRPPLVLEEERADCQGPASCRKCGAELELICPNGHGGADEVLADLTAPKKRAPAPDREESGMLQFSIPDCGSPRVAWKGRGRKPTRCEKHLTKHSEQKRSA